MNRAFVLVLPDREGELARVDRMLSSYGLYVGRVSFNKVIDIHTCFVEVEGSEADIRAAEQELHAAGYMVDQARVGSVRLVELELPDKAGSLLPVLELADSYGLNITYLNARGRGDKNAALPQQDANPEASHGQVVRMGLYIDQDSVLDAFVRDANKICPTRVLAYDPALELLDNNLFYVSYARGIAQKYHLSSEGEQVLLVNMNRIIQNIERTSADPYKPFDYLGQFAETIDQHRGEAYRANTRISRFETAGGIQVLSLEPPCGSTTWVFDLPDVGGSAGTYFVVDTGYACYRTEWLALLREELPDWDQRHHELFLTHADVDHVGNAQLFDTVYAVGEVMDNFRFELRGLPGWRDQNPLFLPYDRITNLLTAYQTPFLDHFQCLGRRSEQTSEPIAPVRTADGAPAHLVLGSLDFEVWEGAGGHVRGETVLIDRAQRLCVSGDIFINIHAQTKIQRRFNLLSPFLMTSVDSVPDLERQERRYLFSLLDEGSWQVLGGHGPLLSTGPHA